MTRVVGWLTWQVSNLQQFGLEPSAAPVPHAIVAAIRAASPWPHTMCVHPVGDHPALRLPNGRGVGRGSRHSESRHLFG